MNRSVLLIILICTATSAVCQLSDSIDLARKNEPKVAIIKLKKLLRQPSKNIDSLNYGMIYYFLGARYKDMGLCDSAAYYSNLAKDHLISIGHKGRRLPLSMSQVGDCLSVYEDNKNAINYYTKATRLQTNTTWGHDAQNYAVTRIIALSLNGGDKYRAKLIADNWVNSPEFNSVSIYQQADTYLAIALLYSQLEHHNKALDFLDSYNTLTTKNKEHFANHQEPLYLKQLADIQYKNNNFNTSLQTYYSVIDKIQESPANSANAILEIKTLTSICANEIELNHIDQAIAAGQKALLLYNKNRIEDQKLFWIIIDNLLTAYYKENNTNEAQSTYRIAKYKIHDSNNSIINFKKENIQSNYYYYQYTQTQNQLNIDSTIHHSLLALEHLNNELNNRSYTNSLLDLRRQHNIASDNLFKYARLIKNLELSWKSIELSKGVLLHENYLNKSYKEQLLAENLINEIDSLNKHISYLKFTVKDEADIEILRLEKQSLHLSEKLLSLEIQNPLDIISLDDVNLHPNTTLINYYGHNDTLYAILINQSSKELLKLCPIDSIHHHIKTIQNISTTAPKITPSLRKLHDLLLPPKEQLSNNILIVPDQSLLCIPFEALLSPDHTPLIQHYNIKYGISYTINNQLRKSPNSKNHIDVVFPSYTTILPDNTINNNQQKLVALKHSEIETTELSGSFKSTVYTNKEKSHISSLIETSNILHFTGHASQHPRDYSLSYLALSSVVSNFKNVLTSSEIENLKSNANLVTLNACNTGTGEIKQGEGVFSLARSFFKAGAKAIVNTLWAIDDASSSMISLAFYDYLSQGYKKSTALRQAKLDYLNNPDIPEYKKHPYYWAGLILIGNDDPIQLQKRSNHEKIYWGLCMVGMMILSGVWYRRRTLHKES